MKNIITDSFLHEAYQETDTDLRLRHTKAGCVISYFCMPAGAALDYYVYNAFLWPFFKIRLLISFLAFIIFLLLYTSTGRNYIKVFGIIWVLMLNLSFCWMIYLTEGSVSPYYAGISLIILGVAVLLPWSVGETLLVCVVSIGMYLLTCLIHNYTVPGPFNYDILFNNVYFLILTSLICTTASHFYSNNRFQDFLLRHELDIRNKKLEELDQLKSQFFANVSHELRTPLTLILSPIEDLLRRSEKLPGKVHESLLVSHRNALRLIKLINELLDIMRLEEKGFTLSKESINLNVFIPGIVDSVRHLSEVKNLRLVSDVEEDSVLVEADPDRMEKVLLNLLSNAVKFTPSGGKIILRIRSKNERALIEVEDDGIGIADEDLPHIFKRFHQVDGATTRNFQGVGIGLALARDLVEKHEGSLTAKSEPGKGTTFTIDLPLIETAEEIEISKNSELPGDEPFAQVFQSANRVLEKHSTADNSMLPAVGSGDFTILVVDDEPDMLRYLVTTLAEEYRVLQAINGEQAIKLTQTHNPDLLLLDWMLPGRDGLAVCRTLRESKMNDLKIILLTARIDEASKIKALEEGADDFLTKPFSTIEVRTRIANQLRIATLQKDQRQRNIELEDTLNQLKNTESQLVQSEKMNAIGSLAAGLLHEINNPLNYTLTALQVGRESVAEENNDLIETMDDIDEGMKRIRDIVSDLRDFAYPSSISKQQRFELNGALDTAVRLLSHEFNGLSITREISDECNIYASKTQFIQVLVNLLMNSSKAVKETSKIRKPIIKVTGKRENENAVISVWDNGNGINPDVLGNIFDPFFTTREVGEGMGLGLSICHTIVKNNGGSIRAISEEGEWTEIITEFPPDN